MNDDAINLKTALPGSPASRLLQDPGRCDFVTQQKAARFSDPAAFLHLRDRSGHHALSRAVTSFNCPDKPCSALHVVQVGAGDAAKAVLEEKRQSLPQPFAVIFQSQKRHPRLR
jgi:hypothetical protein